ncbi:universal stress protein [Paraburkholderia sacchari]
MLVIGMHSTHGLRRFVFGSVAHRVVRTTRTPLLLINMSDS